MKYYKILCFLSLLIIFSSCEPGYQISRRVIGEDPKLEQITSSRIKIKGNNIGDYYKTYLQYQCNKSEESTIYLFSIEYIGHEWIGVEKIELDIDGMESEFSYNRPPVNNPQGIDGLSELMFIPIPENTIIDIIEIRDCKMKIVGQFKTIEVTIKQNWINKLELFYDETLK